MVRINLSLDKTKKYVVACSFGPDSMALLDAAIKENLNIVVAHVNYRKREAAQTEQKELVSYCENRNIPIYVLDLINQKPVGNFQSWARKKRYEFFKMVSRRRAWAAARRITACAMRFSRASVTGASLSRFISRTASRRRCRSTTPSTPNFPRPGANSRALPLTNRRQN